MQKYQSIISGTNGSVIRNVPVTVLQEDGSLAEIFLDREGQVPAPNPLVTDSRGVFYFYAKNGRYSLRTSVDGITITDADAVLLNDPQELATAGPIADAVLRAETAAQRAEDAVEASGIPEIVAAAQNAVVDANNAVGQAQAAASLADTAKNESAAAKVAAENAQSGAQSASAQAGQARVDAQTAAQAAAQSAASIDPAYLRNRANHTGTQPINTVAGLQTALDAKADNSAVSQAIAMAATFTTVPSTFQAWSIVVTHPHLRQMVWSVAKGKYVRAPWHPVGKAGYFLREVGEGFLQVRGDVVLQAADFPDLAEYLGVTGSTFVLDEARGEFIRNADSGRGKDAGRVVGSHQGDAGRNLTGQVLAGTQTNGYQGFVARTNPSEALYTTRFTGSELGIPSNILTAPTDTDRHGNLWLDASRQWPTANEFRPTNRAYIFAVTF